MNEIKVTAYHEAGHAAMAVLFCMDTVLIHKVTAVPSIVKNERRAGHIHYSILGGMYKRQQLANAMIILAAGVAEEILTGEKATILNGSWDDLGEWWEFAEKWELSDNKEVKIISLVEKTVKENWFLVQHIAEMLLDKKSLDGAEILASFYGWENLDKLNDTLNIFNTEFEKLWPTIKRSRKVGA
ncbi:hypothetical protein [Paenibacillus anseongense]|uniref:hypothetical protein n=1 Tax=Paenibacillus anseongense TaxID=2682845 RepID=UPI002DC05BCE|nr:hypothetical protein [Paenibacillus anseongense]MEC0265157.1 hypothetical protein [Paenibacillus anseongense]